MMRSFLFCLFLFISVQLFSQPYVHVNVNATPEAKSVLRYFNSISGKYILYGQQAGDNQFLGSVKTGTRGVPGAAGLQFYLVRA